VLQVDTNRWAESLAAKRSLISPELERDRLQMDYPVARDVDDSAYPGRDARPGMLTAGHSTTARLPFSGGDPDLFHMQPNAYHFGPKPNAAVGAAELTEVAYPDDRDFDLDGTINGWANEIERELREVDADLEDFTSQLEKEARSAIVQRKDAIHKHRERLTRSKIPIGPSRNEQKTYVIDAIERIPPPPAQAMNLRKPLPLEPAISEEMYEDVVTTLRKSAENMEKAATAYQGLGEENLRHVLLLPLNTIYEGQAGAEVFNAEGKADVVLRWEGKTSSSGRRKSGPARANSSRPLINSAATQPGETSDSL
jgi:hypothetical protein